MSSIRYSVEIWILRLEKAVEIALKSGRIFIRQHCERSLTHAEARKQVKNARQPVEQKVEEVAVTAVFAHHAEIVCMRLIHGHRWNIDEVVITGACSVAFGGVPGLVKNAAILVDHCACAAQYRPPFQAHQCDGTLYCFGQGWIESSCIFRFVGGEGQRLPLGAPLNITRVGQGDDLFVARIPLLQ
jgi:hypothetical protein